MAASWKNFVTMRNKYKEYRSSKREVRGAGCRGSIAAGRGKLNARRTHNPTLNVYIQRITFNYHLQRYSETVKVSSKISPVFSRPFASQQTLSITMVKRNSQE